MSGFGPSASRMLLLTLWLHSVHRVVVPFVARDALRLVSQLALPSTAADCSAFAGRLSPMVSRSSIRVSAYKVPFRGAMPNPSIERTCPGKPGQASHLKR